MMFAGVAFGEEAFAEQSYTPLDTSAFQEFLDQASSPRCWLLELDAFSLASTGTSSAEFGDAGFGELGLSEDYLSSAGVVTFRYSTHGYTSQEADSPARTFYEPRLPAPPVVDRQITGSAGLGGLTTLFSEIDLINRDGALDTLMRDYALDGRRARILVGHPDAALSTFGVAFTGVVERALVGMDAARLSLSDGAARLERMVNETSYTGAGALEGGTDLKGKWKPRAFGRVYNASPPLVDTAKLIYQVNDGAVNDVPAVYDRGVSLTQGSDYADTTELNGVAPSAGQYRVLKSGGYFRLGASPAGTVTCDVEGDASPAYVTRTADIVLRLLTGTPALNNSEIGPTAFDRLNTDAPAPVGLWVGPEDSVTCAQAIERLLAGVGAFGGFSRSGSFTVKVLAAASGTEDASYDFIQVLDLVREQVPDVARPIAWRASVGWRPNLTLQSDLAAAVPASRVSFVAARSRIESSEDAAVKTRHLLAVEFGPVDALYADQADATTEAARLLALWGAERSVMRVRLPLTALTDDLGDVILLTFARFGLATGRSGRVIGYRLDGGVVELRVLV